MQSIKHESNSFVQTLWGFGLVVFVVLGICGTIYKLLSPSGWIAGMLGGGIPGGVAAIGLLIVFGVIGWVARTFSSLRQQSGAADLVGYVFAVAGLMYVFQYWSKGTF